MHLCSPFWKFQFDAIKSDHFRLKCIELLADRTKSKKKKLSKIFKIKVASPKERDWWTQEMVENMSINSHTFIWCACALERCTGPSALCIYLSVLHARMSIWDWPFVWVLVNLARSLFHFVGFPFRKWHVRPS